ncbi:MAG TPA: hypothetical protein VGF69_22735 [Thermoanaerobaculia bacterium]|jgi:hypothetical protein
MVAFEKAPPEARLLLSVPIRELRMSLEASPIAPLVRRLYEELEAKGLHHFRPRVYLSDEWGCPSGEPVIGVPFYLGDPRVTDLEAAANDVEGEREIMMYLRHEAGHAFNYAYELYRTEEWHELFGSFRRAYRDDYPFVPFSHDYVRHMAGWYAQKHPDEDFAETFAVWLDPASRWRRRYQGWGALRKLLYVDRIAKEAGDQQPSRPTGETDITVEEMEQTVEEMFAQYHVDETELIERLPLDADLLDIFVDDAHCEPGVVYREAAAVIAEHRRELVDRVNHWTGVRRTLVRALVLRIEERAVELALLATPTQLIDFTAYVTSLAMTFLIGNRKVRHRKP